MSKVLKKTLHIKKSVFYGFKEELFQKYLSKILIKMQDRSKYTAKLKCGEQCENGKY